MPIFQVTSGKLKKLNALALDKEKSLQKLVEENLMEALELRFLDTEYVTTFGGRIDTLAVDTDGAPVIIEYKRNKNDNVINQALSYLKWLKTQKPGFFEKLMIDKLGPEIAGKITLDWKNPRVVCIAESYSKFGLDHHSGQRRVRRLEKGVAGPSKSRTLGSANSPREKEDARRSCRD